MLKNTLLKVAFLCCICITMLQIGCKDSDAPAQSSNTSNQEVDNSFRTINQTDLEFKGILESPELQSILAGFDTPIKKIQIDESEKDVFSYIVTMNPDKGIQREIFLVTKKIDQELLIIPFLRLHNITSSGKDGTFLGKVKWFAADGMKLNEMTVNNNKVSNFSIKDVNSNNARTQECRWLCTYKAFNMAYMAAKNACENDWLCNLSCSFNPCAASYTIAAVRFCASCYTTTPDGALIPNLTRDDIGNLTMNW